MPTLDPGASSTDGPGPHGARPGVVVFRMFASARAAAGAEEVHVRPGPTADVVTSLAADLPPRFADVLAVSSLLAEGCRLDPCSRAPISGGTIVDVLPPFAGG